MTEVALPSDATAIRQVDFSQNADVLLTLKQLGSGNVDTASVIYADLTGDRREEAVVPITSGGSAGNLAYLVFALQGSSPGAILVRFPDRSSAGGLRVSLDEGKLVETAAEFGPEDPFCCPSAVRQTYFRWDGSKLQVDYEARQTRSPGPKQ